MTYLMIDGQTNERIETPDFCRFLNIISSRPNIDVIYQVDGDQGHGDRFERVNGKWERVA